MASKHMVNGRRALRAFEAHIASCSKTENVTPAMLPCLAEEIPAEITAMSDANLGRFLTALRRKRHNTKEKIAFLRAVETEWKHRLSSMRDKQ